MSAITESDNGCTVYLPRLSTSSIALCPLYTEALTSCWRNIRQSLTQQFALQIDLLTYLLISFWRLLGRWCRVVNELARSHNSDTEKWSFIELSMHV